MALIVVTDYGDENPLLMDYYGFQPALYQLKFKSRGDTALSQRVVQLYKDVSLSLDHDCTTMSMLLKT